MIFEHFEQYTDSNGDLIFNCIVRVPKSNIRVGSSNQSLLKQFDNFIHNNGDIIVFYWDECGHCKSFLEKIGGPNNSNNKGIFFIEVKNSDSLYDKYPDLPKPKSVPAFYMKQNNEYIMDKSLANEVISRLT